MPLDPRIARFFPSPSLGDIYIGNALLALLDEAKLTDKVFASMGSSSFDPLHQIGGRPLYDLKMKSRSQLAREGVKQRDLVALEAYLLAHGLSLPADKIAPALPATVPAPKPATKSATAPQSVPVAAPNAEPTFAGKKLSELAGKTDAQLLKIEGISKATIKDIRAAEAATAKNESPPVDPDIIEDVSDAPADANAAGK